MLTGVQRLRFEAQVATHNATMAAAAEYAKAKGDTALASAANDAYEVGMDEDFVTALEYGMPPTAGMVSISPLTFLVKRIMSRFKVDKPMK